MPEFTSYCHFLGGCVLGHNHQHFHYSSTGLNFSFPYGLKFCLIQTKCLWWLLDCWALSLMLCSSPWPRQQQLFRLYEVFVVELNITNVDPTAVQHKWRIVSCACNALCCCKAWTSQIVTNFTSTLPKKVHRVRKAWILCLLSPVTQGAGMPPCFFERGQL